MTSSIYVLSDQESLSELAHTAVQLDHTYLLIDLLILAFVSKMLINIDYLTPL